MLKSPPRSCSAKPVPAATIARPKGLVVALDKGSIFPSRSTTLRYVVFVIPTEEFLPAVRRSQFGSVCVNSTWPFALPTLRRKKASPNGQFLFPRVAMYSQDPRYASFFCLDQLAVQGLVSRPKRPQILLPQWKRLHDISASPIAAQGPAH